MIRLTGKFDFHSIKNNAPAFVREEEKLEGLESEAYYLVFVDDGWYFQDGEYFEDDDAGGWMMLSTEGLIFPLIKTNQTTGNFDLFLILKFRN